MDSRVIAIDIDANSIRLLQARGNRVERWASSSLEAEATQDGATPDPVELGSQIRTLMQASGISGGEVVASVSGLYSGCRVLSIPPQPAKETEQALPELAQEALPAEGLTLRWQIMAADETSQQILVLGMPTELVDGQVAILRAAGIHPRVAEMRAMALTRAVDRQRAIIVNVEATNLDVVVVANGIPHIMRTLPQPGTPSPEDRAERVAQAVGQTISFYNSNNPQTQLSANTPLFLVGSLAEDPALRERVSTSLDYPLEALSPSRMELPPHLPSAQYAVNIGLVLRRLSRSRSSDDGVRPINIDFLPRTSSPWRITPQRLLALLMVVVGLFLANTFYGQVTTAGQETAQLQQELNRIEQQVNQRRAEQANIREMKATIKDFQALTAPWGDVSAAIEYIQQNATEGITISSYKISGQGVEFSVKADSVDEAIDYVEALRAIAEFSVLYPKPNTDINATLKLPLPEAK